MRVIYAACTLYLRISIHTYSTTVGGTRLWGGSVNGRANARRRRRSRLAHINLVHTVVVVVTATDAEERRQPAVARKNLFYGAVPDDLDSYSYLLVYTRVILSFVLFYVLLVHYNIFYYYYCRPLYTREFLGTILSSLSTRIILFYEKSRSRLQFTWTRTRCILRTKHGRVQKQLSHEDTIIIWRERRNRIHSWKR